MKKFASLLVLLISVFTTAQRNTSSFEKYPVFSECKEVSIEELQSCFNHTLEQFIFDNFKTPDIVSSENYSGKIDVFFEINKEGEFKVLYVDGIYNELKDEVNRVFKSLPQIAPATYNGNPAYVQFTVSLTIPMEQPSTIGFADEAGEKTITSGQEDIELMKNEYDAIEKLPYANEEYKSNINIPLSHHNYSLFDPALNRVGQNNHTAQKPYIYSEVNKYYNFEKENQKLLKNKSTSHLWATTAVSVVYAGIMAWLSSQDIF